MAEPTWRL